MEYQFRRGIYRPNAQRLSISLAPLVAQRSLLFRVKADLATKTNYSELTPTDEVDSAGSPALFVVTASASARIMSAARSALLSAALSSCSVYSQESWQGPSPFVHQITHTQPQPPLPAPRASKALLQVDNRRHAIAFSPSVQWESMSNESDSCDRRSPMMKIPPQPVHPIKPLSETLPAEGNVVESPIKDEVRPNISSNSVVEDQSPKNVLPVKLGELEGGPASTLKKKNNAANRVSKHAKAFGKAISHLSMQPSKKDPPKEVATARRLTTANIKHLGPEYKLPSLRIRVSPIRTSFINNPPAVIPLPLVLPQMVAEREGRGAPLVDVQLKTVGVAGVRPRPPRSIRPTTPSCPQPPTSPSPPPMPFKKGHKRYNSSPAVLNFNFNARHSEDVPPLPALPSFVKKGNSLGLGLPVRPRAASVSTPHGHVRAISVPFPIRRSIS